MQQRGVEGSFTGAIRIILTTTTHLHLGKDLVRIWGMTEGVIEISAVEYNNNCGFESMI